MVNDKKQNKYVNKHKIRKKVELCHHANTLFYLDLNCLLSKPMEYFFVFGGKMCRQNEVNIGTVHISVRDDKRYGIW